MSASQRETSMQSRWHRPSRRLAVGAGALMLLLVVSFTAMALAAGPTPTVSAASNSQIGEKVAVNAQGRTLYHLSPETRSHLLCTSKTCLKAWVPVTVRSAKSKPRAGSGVQGRLAVIHRHGGILQVTLRGLPLYRFVGDKAKGEANGEGIKSFGGTWHVVSAAANPSSAPASGTESTSSTSTSSAEPYPYPSTSYSSSTSTTSTPTTTTTTTSTTSSYTYTY